MGPLPFSNDFMDGDIPINMISYEEFGKLKFLEFFPRTSMYDDDSVGGTVTIIGYACVTGYAFTRFARVEGTIETAAINLDFSHDCPEPEGNALLTRLGLNLFNGASLGHVWSHLGTPKKDQTSPVGFRFCSFTVGERWSYRVNCAFDESGKLYQVGVAREDAVVQNEQTQ